MFRENRIGKVRRLPLRLAGQMRREGGAGDIGVALVEVDVLQLVEELRRHQEVVQASLGLRIFPGSERLDALLAGKAIDAATVVPKEPFAPKIARGTSLSRGRLALGCTTHQAVTSGPFK